jgi:hypothetical protein
VQAAQGFSYFAPLFVFFRGKAKIQADAARFSRFANKKKGKE